MHSLHLPNLIAVIGPTASGKTALGISLAESFGGEIVSADAKQVYRGMDIGTAKERNSPVKQHLLDIKNPGETITVAEYQSRAYKVIDGLVSKGIVPILVGGSGLYAESVINGYEFVAECKSKLQKPRYRVLKMGVEIEREVLKARAADRLRARMEEGLVDEVRGLLGLGVSAAWLKRCGIEYRYVTEYLSGEVSLEECSRKIEIATNQFIKRQYTWWRRHDDVIWLKNASEANNITDTFLRS
jgi:tRNA dimethylallyltransferase